MSPSTSAPPPAANRHRLRWLAPPAVAAVLVAGAGFGPGLFAAGAGAAPVLPAISAQDLVARIVGATPPSFSGTVQTRTNLGLPSVGSLFPSGSSVLSMILTPHTIKVSAAPGGKFHLAVPDGLTETDVVSDGSQVWVWQSSDQSVTHLAQDGAGGTGPHPPGPNEPAAAEPTPDALAKKLLAQADPTTRVFVRGTATVAGRDAYELVLAPTTPDTLVADVIIDVDAATSLPLSVQVLAKDAGTPALEVGFTDISLGAQPPSAFTFTPPPGAKVTEAASPEELLFGPPRLRPEPGGPPVTRRAGGGQKVVPGPGLPPRPPGPTVTPAPETRVLGQGWESVVAIPDGPAQLGAVGRPVSGAWGSGRLVASTLADALVLDDGTVLVGAVGPDRLEAAVAELHAHP
jgi:outer membrane lipoprotein-sorting protein